MTDRTTTVPVLYLRWYVQHLVHVQDAYRQLNDEYGADLHEPDGHEAECEVRVNDRTFTVTINIQETTT